MFSMGFGSRYPIKQVQMTLLSWNMLSNFLQRSGFLKSMHGAPAWNLGGVKNN